MSSAIVDPKWAWSLYRPTAAEPWDHVRAGHLLRRAGFGATQEQREQAVADGCEKTVSRLVAAVEPTGFQQQMVTLEQGAVNAGSAESLSAIWAYRILSTPAQLLEKMTLFWHGHFATSAAKVTDPTLMLNQNRLLRQYALGDFRQLVQDISKDPAMLIYLDSATNRKSHPNENYAREIMELFCLGEGNYSEKDIQELARCFTGWEVRRKRFRFNRYQHDFGNKSVLKVTGKLTGEQAIDVVVKQPAAPRFIARKLIQFFVMDEPQPSDELIEPLARTLRGANLQIRPTLDRLFRSNLFYSTHAISRKVRSPVELALGLLRTLQGTTNTPQLATAMRDVGQGLYYPPNVKGWDGGRTWINSSTLLGRANLIRTLINDKKAKTRFAGGTLQQLLEKAGVDGPQETVQWLSELLLAIPLDAVVQQNLAKIAADANAGKRGEAVLHALSIMPALQLG